MDYKDLENLNFGYCFKQYAIGAPYCYNCKKTNTTLKVRVLHVSAKYYHLLVYCKQCRDDENEITLTEQDIFTLKLIHGL